jgi:hypothetical protein
MKLLKVFLVLVSVALLSAILLAAGGWFMLRGTPDWYKPVTSTPEQRKAAAERAEAMMRGINNWAAASRAARLRAAAAAPENADEPTTHQAAAALAARDPSTPFQIQFTDEELNAFFEKWVDINGRREAIAQYVTDPRLVLRDNQLILAGTVKDLGAIVSMQFEPKIDEQGRLQMSLVHVLGGILPLPNAVWSKQRAKVEQLLQSKLPAYQQAAALAPDGTANAAAASAGMNKMLLAILRGEPADPVLFVPYDPGKLSRSLPVKITNVSIHDNAMTITAEQMTNSERAGLLERLHAPSQTETAVAR